MKPEPKRAFPVNQEKINHYGDELFTALRNQRTLSPLTEREPQITIEDAYQISLRMVHRRVEDGETIIGKKIGVSSKVVQQMLNVHQPDFGYLTSSMAYENHANMPISRELIQPRAEGELAFKLKKDLIGPNVTPEDVLAATEYVTPCFEVVDSRIENWKIKIQDTVADNASCGLYVLGDDRIDPTGIDLAKPEMVVRKNGEIISRGFGSAALGNPLICVAWLANTLSTFGVSLKAGETILSGSWVPLEPVTAGDTMSLEIEGIGAASVNFT